MQLPGALRKILNEPLYQLALLLFLFQAVFVSPVSHPFDHHAFNTICDFIFEQGVSNAYQCSVFNYPPLICYPYYLFGLFQGSVDNIDRYFYFFKLFALLFDYIAALSIVALIGKPQKSILFFLLLVANPAFIYNSYCWGQVDGVLSALVFLSFVFLYKEKFGWGLFFFILAINFKLQAIIFLPPLMMIAVCAFWGKLTVKNVIRFLSVAVITELIIILPFLLNGQISAMVKPLLNYVDLYPQVNLSAVNLWYLLYGEQARFISDQIPWVAGITYKHFGLLMFCLASFFAMLPLFLRFVSTIFKQREVKSELSGLLAMLALIPLLFYFLNTQMHERYCHPALVFLAAFAFAKRRYLPFALMCLAYFGSLEYPVKFFQFSNYKLLIFNRYWIASLYLLTIVLLYIYLYRDFFKLQKNEDL